MIHFCTAFLFVTSFSNTAPDADETHFEELKCVSSASVAVLLKEVTNKKAVQKWITICLIYHRLLLHQIPATCFYHE